MLYIKHAKQKEESLKSTRSRVFLTKFELFGWPIDETLSRVFDISSQSKQKLESERRSKIVKIYAN